MMTVRIGSLTFEVETHARTTSVKVTQMRSSWQGTEVTGGAQTDETKAALKAILAYIS